MTSAVAALPHWKSTTSKRPLTPGSTVTTTSELTCNLLPLRSVGWPSSHALVPGAYFYGQDFDCWAERRS